jgi:cell division protein FtsB
MNTNLVSINVVATKYDLQTVEVDKRAIIYPQPPLRLVQTLTEMGLNYWRGEYEDITPNDISICLGLAREDKRNESDMQAQHFAMYGGYISLEPRKEFLEHRASEDASDDKRRVPSTEEAEFDPWNSKSVTDQVILKNDTIVALTSAVSELQADHKRLREEMNQLETDNKREITDLRGEMDQLETDNKRLTSEITDLREGMNELRSTLQRLLKM